MVPSCSAAFLRSQLVLTIVLHLTAGDYYFAAVKFTTALRELARACADKAVECVTAAKREVIGSSEEPLSVLEFCAVAKQWKLLGAHAAASVGVTVGESPSVAANSRIETIVDSFAPADDDDAKSCFALFVQTVALTEVCTELSMPRFTVEWDTIGNPCSFAKAQHRVLDELIAEGTACIVIMPAFQSTDETGSIMVEIKPVVIAHP